MMTILKFPAFLLSILYGLIAEIRNWLFSARILRVHTFSKPVISVGNITAGGTGKTPMVIALAQTVRKLGFRPGIVSRGYGRTSRGSVMVHDGSTLLSDPASSGDEPYLMGSVLKTVPVIVDADRVSGIHRMIEECQVDVILLDDAFQHRQADRDVDILLINSTAPADEYRLLPLGRLRESIRQGNRADLVVYTKCVDGQLPQILSFISAQIRKPAVYSFLSSTIMQYTADAYQPVDEIPSDLTGFCGIGDPESFLRQLDHAGVKLRSFRAFADHQDYTPQVMSDLEAWIRETGTTNIITTEKDLVKLPDGFFSKFAVFALRIQPEFNSSDASVIDQLIRALLPDPQETTQ